MIELDPLRRRLRAERARLGPAERMAAASGVAAMLERLPEFLVDANVAGYWAVAGEVPLHVALVSLRGRGQRYHLPVLRPDRTLAFAPWRQGADLQPNRYGIPEPVCADADHIAAAALDLVLVPLLAFDRRGNRLGTGGGYYDRSFSFLNSGVRPAQPVLVGIGYGFQEVATLPERDWDVRMDFVATERELIECPGPVAP